MGYPAELTGSALLYVRMRIPPHIQSHSSQAADKLIGYDRYRNSTLLISNHLGVETE